MFKFFIITTLIALAAAGDDDVHADTTLLKSDVRHDGYDWALDTSNHIHQVASGDEHGNSHGEFSWVDPHGVKVEIKYVANEHGYQPEGDLVPKIPDYILKAIEYIKSHPSHEDEHHHK